MPAAVTAEERCHISQGLYAYCRGLDRFDRDLALSPFAADAHLVYSGLFEGTAVEFVDWIWPIHARMVVHVHRVANIFVDRDSQGRLVSESYIQVLLRSRGPADGSMTDNVGDGRYVDRWVDDNGTLTICERDYIRDAVRTYAHVPNDAPAVRAASDAAALASARDGSDASYRLLRG